ncbi:MAG TPA: uroporphyrinogen decarboxylase [Sneathiellales bacterium]|nr:uroporphyrinogen decarboxylase [Sneathiellales bacterium]
MSEDKVPLRKPLLDVLSGLEPTRTPLWLMRQAGRYLPEYRQTRSKARDFLDLCYTPELAVEVTLQPLRRYAAIMFADILLIPDALGQNVAFREGEGPVLEPVRGRDALAGLNTEGLHQKLAPVYETLRQLAQRLPPPMTLIGFAGAPWTVATYMVEGRGSPNQAAAKSWAYTDPIGFDVLIQLLVDATAEYLIAQVDAGAEVLQLFDTWAGNLPPSQFNRWCIQPTADLIRQVKAARPDVPIIGFPRGAGPLYGDYVEATGVNGVSIDTGLSLAWAAKNLQKKIAVQGNLDPLALVAGGDILKSETDKIFAALAGGPHIFNLGHGIVPETPPEHVAELVSLVRSQDGQ